MALLFTGSTADRVEHGTGTSLDNINAGTFLAWVYRTTTDTDRFIFAKGSISVPNGTYLKANSTDSGQGVGSLQLGIFRATTPLIMEPTGTGFVPADTWACVAATWDLAGADGDQHMYTGTRTAILTEPGAYTTRQVGSGTKSTDVGTQFEVGNYAPTHVLSFAGRIGVAAFWNRVLTLGELRQQQFRPHKTSGCVLFTHYGYTDDNVQADWSGAQNQGSLSVGTALAPHVPLSPYVLEHSVVFGAATADTGLAWIRA